MLVFFILIKKKDFKWRIRSLYGELWSSDIVKLEVIFLEIVNLMKVIALFNKS